jgi:serine protease
MLSVNGRLSPGRLTERLRTSARAFPLSSDPTVPVCRVPAGSTDLQLSECSCTTATCGAGIVNAAAAVASALRPIATVDGPAATDAGQTVNLSGAGSVGADGRSIVSYAWSLQSGATSLSALAGSSTSFVAPAYAGDVVVRLTVTDDVGRIDARDAVVKVNGPPPPQPPVTPPPSSPGGGGSGGGGAPDTGLLLLAALLGCMGLRRRHRAPR